MHNAPVPVTRTAPASPGKNTAPMHRADNCLKKVDIATYIAVPYVHEHLVITNSDSARVVIGIRNAIAVNRKRQRYLPDEGFTAIKIY